MVCAYTRPRYQMSVYRTIGPLVINVIPLVKITGNISLETCKSCMRTRLFTDLQLSWEIFPVFSTKDRLISI